MVPSPDDTIVALSTVPGPGARAVVRLSGNLSRQITQTVFQGPDLAGCRNYSGSLRLPELTHPLPCDVYFFPGPRSYTGQDVIEIHTLSCPPLVEQLITQILQVGARGAQPGEFTLRAFLAGKLDLPRAEAVLAVIEAERPDDLKQALSQMAGGVSQPLNELRDDLLNLLADVEASLDFGDEDIRFVHEDELLLRLGKGLAQVTLLYRKLDRRSTGPRPFRVVLLGLPNAGKSSLFNALAGNAAALVSPEPGTTRDYLILRMDLEGIPIELIDTAGLRPEVNGIEGHAQKLGQEQAHQADLILWCATGGIVGKADSPRMIVPTVVVATKSDEIAPTSEMLATSAVTKAGIPQLRRLLAERARAQKTSALAPSLSRCRHHVEACLKNLRRAHAIVIEQEPTEILALELREALDQLGQMVGAVYTDDLLDRIFSRFCIGK